MSDSQPSSVLVVCLRYLGDTLLLRPAFRALREAFPEARLDALVTSGTAVALDDCANVSQVIEWPKNNILGQAVTLFKVTGSRYDWVVDFTGNDRSALVALLSGASLRVVYDRPKLSRWSLRRFAYNRLVPPKKKKPHILIQRQELLEACGVPGQRTVMDLRPRQEALAWSDSATSRLPAGWLHAHLTSRDMQKAIPAPVARRVFESVIASGRGVVLTSGSSSPEREHIALCTEGLPMEHLKVFSDLSWHQLVALISRCGAYWGADTAPSHIAAALQKPMLIHYGPSKAEHWKPLYEAGRADVRLCECLRQKCVACPAGVPGRCLDSIEPAQVLSWFSEAQR